MGFLLLLKGCIPGLHEFAFVSGLAFHSGCCGPHAFTFVSHLSRIFVSRSGRCGPHAFTFVSHLSPTLVSHSGCSGARVILHMSHTCLPLWVLWGPRDFTYVSHLSPALGALGPAWFYICLTLVSRSGCSGARVILHVSPTCLPHLVAALRGLGRIILHLSPTLGGLGRVILHLSPICFHAWRKICCY